MGENKLSGGNVSVMSANLEESAEVNKSWHLYLIVESILMAPLTLS